MSAINSTFASKMEQRINLQFLIKLGKNEDEIFRLLKKVYGDHCMSRTTMVLYFNRSLIEEQNLTSDVDEIEDENMDDNVENTSSNASANTHRIRSNSVIDSIGYRKYSAIVTAIKTRSRSKSLSTTDYTSSEKYVNDLCIAGSSSEVKKSDTIDAKGSITAEKINDTSFLFTAKKESSIPTALMSVAKDADCYNMNHEKRGKCIIFNHENFELSFNKRVGSALDAKRLEKSFGNLGFDVEIYDDFTHNEIISKIGIVSQLDHTNNDCLCIITLTHGVQNDLICAKDVIYKTDQLWKPFTADKCLTLAGKPKLFFIQACRGDETDNGVMLSSRTSIQTETDSKVSYAIPTHADFLIAHSSIQGFFTWRNPSEGTWYIQCLCDILDEHGTTLDLMSMLTLTTRKVATEFSSVNPYDKSLHDKKQVPSVTTMLLRSVYFPPKQKK